MDKHAYLIIAHNEFYILGKLLKLIDTPFYDIYLHVDKKAKEVDFSKLKNVLKKQNIFYRKKECKMECL